MRKIFWLLVCFLGVSSVQSQISPNKIQFTRQGVQRLIFDEKQSITMAKLEPKNIIGLSTMHPQKVYSERQPEIQIVQDKLIIKSEGNTQTNFWFGGFNPFVSYSTNLESSLGDGEFGFEFSDADGKERFIVKILFKDNKLWSPI